MAIRRITSNSPGGEPPREIAPPAEEIKLSYEEARAQAQALVQQLSRESDPIKSWATLYARYKKSGSRVEIGDLTTFVLSQPDEPELVGRVLQDILLSGIPMHFGAMVEKIGNRRLLERLGNYHSSDLARELYIILSTARADRTCAAITEAVKGTRMDRAILCLQWMREIYDSCDELMRATILSYAIRFQQYKERPVELLGKLNAALDALARKGLADPSAIVAWNSFELARSLGWPVSIIDQAMPSRAKSAINTGSPEFGMPFYLNFDQSTSRRFAWSNLTSSWPQTTRDAPPDMLALGDLRPIHSLADFDPDQNRRAPILARDLSRLERLIRKKGTGREVFNEYLFGEGATRYGHILYVCELQSQGGSKQWYLARGIHRLAALYVGGQRGLVPESWLSHIPVHIIQDNGKIPSRLARQVMTDNFDFGWQDLFPPAYADGRCGAKQRVGQSAGRPRGLQPPIQMASALWRARAVAAAPLTMRTHRH